VRDCVAAIVGWGVEGGIWSEWSTWFGGVRGARVRVEARQPVLLLLVVCVGGTL